MPFSKEAFAAKLRGRIAELDTTRKEVAEKTGISEDVINKYARGVYTPGADKIVLLAEVLRCDPNTLMCWK